MSTLSAQAAVGFQAQQLEKAYDSHAQTVIALTEINLSVKPSQFICIVGPSGCGKSTLLKIIAGLITPTTGQILFDGQSINTPPRSALVFQEHGLFPWLTVLENVAFGLEALGAPRRNRETQARQFLGQLGLAEFLGHFPHELSGGMRQRVAIARAMLTEPGLLLMDEPFSALDAQSRLVLQEELLRVWHTKQPTVVYVTHDIEEAILLGDRILVMSSRPGRIQEDINVPLDRPRNLRDRDQAATRDLTWHIWNAIKGEVQQNLHIAL